MLNLQTPRQYWTGDIAGTCSLLLTLLLLGRSKLPRITLFHIFMSVVGIIILLVEVKDHAFSDSSLQVEEELVKHPFSTG